MSPDRGFRGCAQAGPGRPLQPARTAAPGGAGYALLHVEPAAWTWAVWAGILTAAVLGAALAWWPLASPRGLRLQERRYLSEYSVVHHLDPGLGRRGEAYGRAGKLAPVSQSGSWRSS